MPRLSNKMLTTTAVQKLKPKAQRYDVFDAALRGFGVRVAPSGSKTWIAMRRAHGRMVRVTLGRYPDLGLAKAREKAARVLSELAEGNAPQREDADLFENMLDEWLRRDQGKNRSRRNVENAMCHHALPPFRGRKIDAIRRADLIRLLDGIADSGAPVHANRVLAYLRRMFNWCVERGILEASPATGIKPPAKEVSRDRVLTRDELAAVMRGAAKLGYPFGALAQFLVLTGQRLDEGAKATWSEIDLNNGVWTLSGSRTKNGRAHVVHLSAAAIDLLKALPQLDGCEWVFTTTGSGPVRGLSKAKKRLDEASGVIGWTYHDLRRSFATHATETLGISPVVVDRILNHVSGAVKGIAAVYQRGEYLEQRQRALEAWGQFVTQLPETNHVVPLRRS